MSKADLVVTTSWDDGTRTDLKLAGLLKKYGIKGTFYVATAFPFEPLPGEELLALDKDFEIGAHTVNHLDLTTLTLSEAREEIRDSKIYLEVLLEHEVPMFSYPRREYGRDIQALVEQAGFMAVRGCEIKAFNSSAISFKRSAYILLTNVSPFMALRICLRFRLLGINALLDWEARAKAVFDIALRIGGIYHIYGHSAEYEAKNQWGKMERLLSYISGRDGVQYITNGEVVRSGINEGSEDAFTTL